MPVLDAVGLVDTGGAGGVTVVPPEPEPEPELEPEPLVPPPCVVFEPPDGDFEGGAEGCDEDGEGF